MSTLLLSVFFAVSASAYDVEVDGLYYNLNETEKTAEVTYKEQYKASYSGGVEIPSSIVINLCCGYIGSLMYHHLMPKYLSKVPDHNMPCFCSKEFLQYH